MSKNQVDGTGIFSDLYSKAKQTVSNIGDALTFKKNDSYSPSAKRILELKGNLRIMSLVILREPINGIIQKALNIITLGGFNSLKKKLNVDQIFHLYMVMQLQDSSFIKIQKNSTVEIEITSGKILSSPNKQQVPYNGAYTLNQFLQNGNNLMGTAFFSYSASTNNCQDFIQGLLKANGFLTLSLQEFIKQPTDKIIQSFPSISKKIIDTATHLGAIGSRLIGKGIKNKCIKCRIMERGCHISHHPHQRQIEVISKKLFK